MVRQKRRSSRSWVALFAGCMVVVAAGGRSEGRLAAVQAASEEQAFEVTLAPLSVPTYGMLTITWTAPEGRAATDWVGLFALAAPYEIWWAYTGGAPAGTVTLTAPATPGNYEARYLLEDGYSSVATSAPITVAGPPPFTVSLTPDQCAARRSAHHRLDGTGWSAGHRLGRPVPSRCGLRNLVDLHEWRSVRLGYGRRAGCRQLRARYLLEDGYVSTAKSALVTVGGSDPTPADVVRFLEQSTFGPTTQPHRARAEHRLRELPERAVQRADLELPDPAAVSDDPRHVTCPNNSTCQRDNYTLYPLQNRFFVNALYGPDQLRQRVALALHQIIVVSGST